METEIPERAELTPERRRELAARFAQQSAREDEGGEADSAHEEPMTDVVAQMRAAKRRAAPADPAAEAARRKVAVMEGAGAKIAELVALSEKAGKGDRLAKERVIAILDADPELCSQMADVSRCSEVLLLEAISGGIFAYQAALVRRADAMRRELLAEHPSILERTAVDNVLLSESQLQLVDARFASAARRGERLGAWSKMRESAAKGYQNAIKSLELTSKASRSLSRSSSSAAPNAAAPANASAAKRTRSKPAKQMPEATPADKPSTDCNEQQNCSSPVRPPTGPIRTTRKPANRVAEFVGTSGAPSGSNGHTTPSEVGALNGK